MLIQKFEDIVAWQKARLLCVDTYMIFQHNKDYSFRDQISRAAVSVMNNIAEGFERRSDKQFKYFLLIAKGSCAEYRSMLYLDSDIGYIANEDYQKLYALSDEISKMLGGLISKIHINCDD